MSQSPANGNVVNQKTIGALFLEGPCQFLVPRLMTQLSKVKAFTDLFGPFKGVGESQQRWADYQRFDWSVRQLPAINVFEADTDQKQNENGYLLGTIRLQVFWPQSLRRSDLARIPQALSAALTEFCFSDLAFHLLDSRANQDRTVVVPGLNEFGKETSDTKNIEGIVESELVPVTIYDIRFRLDLRAFYRFLEMDNRTKENPFDRTIDWLTKVFGEYDGVTEQDPVTPEAVVADNIIIDP